MTGTGPPHPVLYQAGGWQQDLELDAQEVQRSLG